MTSDADQRSADAAIIEAYRAHARSRPAAVHPDEEAWADFASGTMDPAARLRFADHVVGCEACRQVHDAVHVLMHGAATVDPEARPSTAHAAVTDAAWWRRRAFGLAAAVALTVGAASLFRASRAGESADIARPADAHAATMAVTPTPTPEAPLYRLAMVRPDVQLPADLLVTTRGEAGAEARQFLERFGEAITPYRDGRFEDAAARLEAMSATHGEVAEVWFYLGVSQLFAGRPAQALTAFDRPELAAAFGDDLQWQRAVALERLGRGPESDAVLSALCARDGRYREQACTAVTKDARIPSEP